MTQLKYFLTLCCCLSVLCTPLQSRADDASLCDPVLDGAILFLAFECINDSTAMVIDSTAADADGWQYSDDEAMDGVTFGRVGGEEFEIYGLAFRETETELWFVLNANLPLAGFDSSYADDDNIGWGDLFIDLDNTTDFKTSSTANDLYGIRFAGTNDSDAPQVGVYGSASAKSVSSENHGFNDWDHYVSYVTGKSKTPGLGDFGNPQTYYAGDLSSSVLSQFSSLGSVSFLSPGDLAGVNFDATHFPGIVSIAFKIQKRLIIDECGVIGGDGSSCADCNDVACGTAVEDACGVCGGDSSSCADCAGVPYGILTLDDCGICGGDGSSCAPPPPPPPVDCNGVPNGTATIDVCGVCDGDGKSCVDCAGTPNGTQVVDQCGVCGGDGTSCLGCSGVDITETQHILDGNAVGQRHWNLYALKQVSKLSRRVRKKQRKKLTNFVESATTLTEQFYIQNWNIVWTIPSVQQSCTNEVFCVSESNADVKSAYEENARGFFTVLNQTSRKIRSLSKRGKAKARKIRRKGKRLLAESLKNLDAVPDSQSSCN